MCQEGVTCLVVVDAINDDRHGSLSNTPPSTSVSDL
jgi:hypothetical protein